MTAHRLTNPVCDPKQIVDNLAKMQDDVKRLAPHLRVIEQLGGKSGETPGVGEAYAKGVGAYRIFVQDGAPLLFQGILQQYQLPNALRKQVEAGARFYGRRTMPRPKTVRALRQLMRSYETYAKVASEAVRAGTPHDHCKVSSNREIKAGPFRLINTGNFDKATMETARRVVEEAARLMAAKGLGAALYGDISISNTVMRKSNVLAFYYPEHDDMFVRANLPRSFGELPDSRGETGAGGFEKSALHTVIHELAHRYDFKILKDPQALSRLYWEVENEHSDIELDATAAAKARPEAPKIGDKVVIRGVQYEVTGLRSAGRVYHGIAGTVNLRLQDGRIASLPLASYLIAKGVSLDKPKSGKGFPTPYAKKDSRENFAEMVTLYCLGTLPPHQVKLLERLLPKVSGAKPASAPKPAAAPKPARAPKPKPANTPKTLTPAAYADALILALGLEPAEAFAMERALQNRVAYWVEVYAAVVKIGEKRSSKKGT